MIELQDATFSYRGTSDATALAGVTVSFPGSSVTAVLGANGSGKSTLGLICAGLLVPDSGTAAVDGRCLAAADRDKRDGPAVGIVFQDPDDQIVGTVVEEDVAFGPENLGVDRPELRARVDEALALTGLAGLERREPHVLSGGQKQRLAIAGAVAMRPEYLVLDEPTAMLDPRGKSDVLRVIRTLRDAGTGVVHITHDVIEAMHADRALVLAGGRVVFDGSPTDLAGDPSALAAFGLSVPPLLLMIDRLRAHGLYVPDGVRDVAGLVGALWD